MQHRQIQVPPMLDVTIAHSMHKLSTAITPWLVGFAVGFLMLWLILFFCQMKAFAKPSAWFSALTPFRKVVAVATACFFTLWGGSKDVGDRGGVATTREGTESRIEVGGMRTGASGTNLWFSGIERTTNSVALDVAWNAPAFSDPPFLEFFVRTNLASGAWMPVGWAEAAFGETNMSVEVEAARLPGGAMPTMAFFKVEADDGLGADDADDDGDGIPNAEERALGTNPRRADTDGDGFLDGIETVRVSYGDPLPGFDLSSLSNVLSGVVMFQPFPASVTVDIPFGVDIAGVSSRRAAVHVEGIVAFLGDGVQSIPAYGSFGAPAGLYATSQGAVAVYGCLFWTMGGLGAQLRAGIVHGTPGRWFVAEWRNMIHPTDFVNLTLESSAFLLAVSEVDPMTVFVRYESLGGSIDGSTGLVGAHGFDGLPDMLVADCVPGSVTNGMVIAYHFGPGTDPMNPDTDSDGFPDGWEYEYGLNPLVDNAADGDPRTDADADPDRDGLTNAQEAALGINPFQPDTDGDGMDDGWEHRHGFEPMTHNSQTPRTDDDSATDPDGDGLTNAEECAWGTNPQVVDSDGDGVADGAEVAQSSDPADATDGGVAGSRVAVQFYFGDHSTSHSEKYILTVEPVVDLSTGAPPRAFSWVNAGYGQCETRTATLKPGWSYKVRLDHASTNREQGPDYDYTLEVLNAPASITVADSDGLFGVHSSSDTFTGAGKVASVSVHAVTGVTICKPDDSSWTELEESRVVLDDEELRIKIEIAPQVSSLAQCRQMFGDSLTVKTSGTCPEGVSVAIGNNATLVNTSGKSEVRIAKTRQQLKSLGLLPENDNDGVDEMAWLDVPETSGQDLSDSMAFSALGYEFRGKAVVATNPNLEASPPISQRSPSFMQAAGCEMVLAAYGNVNSAKRQIMNQADYFYFSGHGSHATGSLQGGLTPSLVRDSWNRDLDVVIFAGCSVLNIGDFRSRSFMKWKTKAKYWFRKKQSNNGGNPGMLWENIGAKYLLGYCWTAPLDTQGSAAIASTFIKNLKNNMSAIDAWGDANSSTSALNACAIDVSSVHHKFWYWDETSGVPVWTNVVKGVQSW